MSPAQLQPDTLAERRRLQWRLRLGLTVLVITTGALILAVLFVGSARRVQGLCRSMLLTAADRSSAEMGRFFQPVRAALDMTRAWGADGQLDPADMDALTARFVPLMQSWPQVSSMMVADTAGAEAMLLRVGDTWTTRSVAAGSGGKGAVWQRWGGDDLAETWNEDLDYDPRIRPWYRGAMELAQDDPMHWTDAYTFFTTKDPGITASTRTGPMDDPGTRVLAFDLLLTDISAFTTGLELTENGFVVIMDDDGRVLGLPRDPRFGTPEACKPFVLTPARKLGLPALEVGLNLWRRAGKPTTPSMSYEVEGETHWAGLRPVELDGDRVAWIGVFVPEADLLGTARTEQAIVLGLLALALVVAIVLATIHGRKIRAEVQAAVERAKRLGQYTLVRKLGAGGMGTVYLARHSMLRRQTAVKLITKDDDPAAVTRFEREVQSTASLKHPHTIEIYDYGRTPSGTFYYAMEYLAGIDLAQLVDRYGPLPAGRVIELLLQVCESLAEAHGKGLIHRDIKPANIIVSRYGGTPDFVKVLDFGLVKSIEDDGDVTATEAHSIKGTPHYMSPESINDPQSVDARSDLYALGAVAYFLLTGQQVFDGESGMAVLVAQTHEAPRPPSERIEGEVPADLEALVLQCLGKSPEVRPQSARDLRARLLACQAAGAWTEEEADRWWDQHESEIEAAVGDADAATATLLDVDLATRRDRSEAARSLASDS